MKYEDEIKGKGKQVKGKAKEKIGHLAGNPRLEDEGRGEQVRGRVEEGFGKARRKIGDAVEDAGKEISR